MTVKLVVKMSALLSLILLTTPSYYWVKAEVAQHLLANAWAKTQVNQVELIKPWKWADTWPVLELSILTRTYKHAEKQATGALERLGRYIVLADTSGESLAFGPGLLTTDILPGDMGNSIIAAHRDTQFAVLQDVSLGDVLEVTSSSGQVSRFVLDQIRIVNSQIEKLETDLDERRLTLVTCYPFERSGEPTELRFIVSGKLIIE